MHSNDSTMTSVRLVKSKKGPRIVVKGNLTVVLAERLHRIALEAAHLDVDVTADFAAAEDLDASAMQVLIALRRSLRKRGRDLRLAGSSPLLDDSLRLAGLLES
jgi:anti-anti-sigma regulatory factor